MDVYKNGEIIDNFINYFLFEFTVRVFYSALVIYSYLFSKHQHPNTTIL